MADPVADPSALAQYVASVIVAIFAAVGAVFAKRAKDKGQENKERLTVPPGPNDQEGRAPGAVLGKLEKEIHELSAAANHLSQTSQRLETTIDDMRQEQGALSNKVEGILISAAEHKGQHEGIMRELERVMRAVFNGDRRDKDRG